MVPGAKHPASKAKGRPKAAPHLIAAKIALAFARRGVNPAFNHLTAINTAITLELQRLGSTEANYGRR